jgi:ABC-type polysaccharide/polyol phosphate transport system ATPase subunit
VLKLGFIQFGNGMYAYLAFVVAGHLEPEIFELASARVHT